MNRILLYGLSIALAGCSVLHRRNPLPAELANNAVLPGYADIRDWGDHFSPILQRSTQNALTAEAESSLGQTPIQYLSLSGGGMNGAFGAGFLCGWTAHGSRPVFDCVTGISAGALLAPFAFAGTNRDGVLREIYSNLRPDQLFRRKSWMRIIRDDSVFDTAPLKALLKKAVTPDLLEEIAQEHAKGRRLWIGTANLDAGRPVIWDMGVIAASGQAGATDLFIQVMMASAAVPGAFPPAYFTVRADGKEYDELHVDGGIGRQAFAYGPALHLDEIRRRLNGRQRSGELYIIRNGDLVSHYAPVKPKTLGIVMNSLNALTHHQAEGDFYRMFVFASRDKFEFYLTGIPREFKRKSSKEFDPAEMRRLFTLGEAMGRSGKSWLHTPWEELETPKDLQIP